MRIFKLWPGFTIALTLVVAACGGGGGGSSVSAPTAAPTTAPTAVPSPGALQVAYTTSYGATSAATAAPAALTFQAETQTATITASQANYTGSYAAALGSGCGTNVSLSATTSSTGQFTVTAVGPLTSAANCSITFSGASGTSTVSVGATIPAPGGVQLQWVAAAALAQATSTNPAQPLPGPINLIGTTSLFQAVLVVSENAYVSTFNTPVLSAGCGTNLTSPLASFTPASGNPITGAPAGTTQARAYYVVVAPSTATGVSSASNCTVTVTDKQTTPSSASIGVTLTTTGGGIQ